MSGMFSDASSFTSDLSTWDVSSVVNMYWIFYYAASFNQNLCAWGRYLEGRSVDLTEAFKGTACPRQNDYVASNGGPLCHACSANPTQAPSLVPTPNLCPLQASAAAVPFPLQVLYQEELVMALP